MKKKKIKTFWEIFNAVYAIKNEKLIRLMYSYFQELLIVLGLYFYK